MPNRAQRRSGETSEFDKMGFRVTTHTARGTEPYEIKLADMTALDEFDFHQQLGQTFMEALGNMSAYALAGFIWLERRRYEKKLTFQEVSKEIKFRDLETIEFAADDEDDEMEDTDPEVDVRNPERFGGPSGNSSPGSPVSTG